MNMQDLIGFTVMAPRYYFGDLPCMLEGARRIYEFGSRTIKLVLSPNYRGEYPHNHDWPELGSLTELVSHPQVKPVFDMNFHTFVLEAYPLSPVARDCPFMHLTPPVSDDCVVLDENTGLGEPIKRVFCSEQLKAEYEEIYRFASYLHEEYAGSGKTFIIQNWESDWSVRGKGDPNMDPPPEKMEQLVTWINNRQDAVDAARRDHPGSGVNVWNCAEVNLVAHALEGRPTVTTCAVPKMRCDIYSYSSYDTSIAGTQLSDALDLLLKYCPPSETVGDKNLFIGEYGLPENEFPVEQQLSSLENVVTLAMEKGLRHVIYWELYCNEKSLTHPSGCRGFWLIRKDGSPAPCYPVFKRMLEENEK